MFLIDAFWLYATRKNHFTLARYNSTLPNLEVKETFIAETNCWKRQQIPNTEYLMTSLSPRNSIPRIEVHVNSRYRTFIPINHHPSSTQLKLLRMDRSNDRTIEPWILISIR